jgi:hypothetical protein
MNLRVVDLCRAGERTRGNIIWRLIDARPGALAIFGLLLGITGAFARIGVQSATTFFSECAHYLSM